MRTNLTMKVRIVAMITNYKKKILAAWTNPIDPELAELIVNKFDGSAYNVALSILTSGDNKTARMWYAFGPKHLNRFFEFLEGLVDNDQKYDGLFDLLALAKDTLDEHRGWHNPDKAVTVEDILKTPMHPDVKDIKSNISIKLKKISQRDPIDIDKISSQLQFKPIKKQALEYSFVPDGNVDNLSPMTYTQVETERPIETYTSDGLETKNVAKPGNYVLSGPSGELYVLKQEKLNKMYTGKPGGIIIPEQTPRQVAIYNLPTPMKFIASWGEEMIIKPGDYLVKEPDGSGYYRIAKKEFEQTYNPIK